MTRGYGIALGMDAKVALVTGSTGFIGSNLCARLCADGWQVRALVRRTGSRKFLQGLDLTICEGDLNDPSSLGEAAQGASTIFHLAAQPPDWGPIEEFRRNNVTGTRHVLEAALARRVPRVFHMSSLSVHEFTGHVDASEDTPFLGEAWLRRSETYAYGQSKAEAERLAFDFGKTNGLAVSSVRTGMAYGPNDHGIFFQLAEGIRKGIYSHVAGGHVYMPVCYVENLIDGILLSAAREQAVGRVFNIVDDGKLTMRQFVEQTCDALGWKRPRGSVPLGVAAFTGALLEDLYRLVGASKGPPVTRYRVAYVAKHLHFSNARATRELGWTQRVPLAEGLRKSAVWYHAYVGRQKPQLPASKPIES